MNYIMLLAAPTGPKLGIFVASENAVSSISFSLVVVILVYIMISRAKAGKSIPEIRKISGIEAFEEAIGRATEMGKPVHVANFGQSIGSESTFAFWSYLAYISKLCAQYDTRITTSDSDYFVNGVNQEIVRQSYLEAGKPDAFNPNDIRFITGQQFPWAMSVVGYLQREKPAAQFLIGTFLAEALILAETGVSIGAIQISCSASQTPMFIATCDYVMIGEEMYAGAAYLSKDPVITGTVVAQDLLRVVFYVLTVLGALWQTVLPESNPIVKALKF